MTCALIHVVTRRQVPAFLIPAPQKEEGTSEEEDGGGCGVLDTVYSPLIKRRAVVLVMALRSHSDRIVRDLLGLGPHTHHTHTHTHTRSGSWRLRSSPLMPPVLFFCRLCFSSSKAYNHACQVKHVVRVRKREPEAALASVNCGTGRRR